MKSMWKYKIIRGIDLIRHDRKRFIRSIVYLTLRTRFVSRARLWFRLLRRLQGATILFEAGLVLSAIVDTILFGFHGGFALSPKSLFSGIVRSKKSGCSWMVRAGTDDIYHAMPEREGEVHRVICSSLSWGDVFVDVGANIGYYTVLASNRVGAKGAVIAFEPMSETFACLQNNCELNDLDDVTLIPKAAWSDEGTLSLFFSGGYYGMASVTQSRGNSISVGAVRLDTICEPYDHIRLLKIDAEGAEYEILLGARLTLKKTKYVVIECGDDHDRITKLLQGDFDTKTGLYELCIGRKKMSSCMW